MIKISNNESLRILNNKNILLSTIMNQIGINDSDLEKDESWIFSKIREAKINKILD